MNILICIPSYNEEENIGSLVKTVSGAGYPVLVIDDGSQDRTAECARENGARVLMSEVNRGKGAALKRGIIHAAEHDYDAVLLMDGDGQHDPAEIPDLVSAFRESGADVLIGTRMGNTVNMPFVRRVTNIVTSYVVSRFAGVRVTDCQSGFRIIKTAVFRAFELRTDRFETEAEMIIRAGRAGFSIRETPVSTIYRSGRNSSIRPAADTVRFFRMLLGCLKK
jgi:glycosyltransferase involved in cell wall biosynthesis